MEYMTDTKILPDIDLGITERTGIFYGPVLRREFRIRSVTAECVTTQENTEEETSGKGHAFAWEKI